MQTWDDYIRLFLHLIAGSIWVGGQIVLAGLVAPLREVAADAPAKAARAYNRLAWPAYGVLFVTGIWNMLAVPAGALDHMWLGVKILVVLLSGIGALVHQFANGNKLMLAVGGAASGLFAIVAMYLGLLVA